ncbi:putative disease resistance protein RGA4 [Spatholobus suberectus]|nr:putative disease resistance protein RGA4 [Spatholobus suberectus]
MSANPVADTISEIMKRMSSLRGFGPNITENIKYHLTVIKDKCSGLAKLDLSDPETREWVGQVTDLFYLVDDLCDDVAPLSKQSKNRSLFSACKLAPLLQLKQIEKRLLRKVAPMKNVKMLTGRDAKEEGEAETAVRDYVKKTIRGSILKKEKGVVRVVVIHGITGMGKAKVAKYVCEDEEVKSLFDVMTWIDGDHLQGYYAESVVDRVNHGLEEEKKKEDSDNVKGFLVILNNFQNENQEEWLKLANNLKGVAAASSVGGTLVLTTMSFAVLRSFRYKFEVSSAHWFDWLNSRESLALFKQFAGTSASAIESTTRDALLEMCGGVVGAIETVARLVRSRKQTTESDINELKDEFVQEMQLKYYSELDLPSWRLWQCFAYSLFLLSSQNSGKGECVKREKLVRLWMAEGFLGDSSSSSSEPEDLGHEYIQEFLRRSIFTENEDGEISIYKRQALAAAFVVGNDSAIVEDKAIIDNHARRVSLKSGLDVSYGNPRSLFETKESGEEWKGMENLSTLVIEDMSNLESLPKGIEHLALLESLVIKNCPNLTTLPENLGKNLPSAILIEDCPKLASLPEKLRDLLLLEIRNCPLLEAWNQRRPKLVFNPLQQLDSLPRL